MTEDKIFIDHREDICTICYKYYKHRKRYGMWTQEGLIRVKEVELLTCHPTCRDLLHQREQLNLKLIGIEWRLQALKSDY